MPMQIANEYPKPDMVVEWLSHMEAVRHFVDAPSSLDICIVGAAVSEARTLAALAKEDEEIRKAARH